MSDVTPAAGASIDDSFDKLLVALREGDGDTLTETVEQAGTPEAQAAPEEEKKPSWKEVILPEDDPEIPGFFKGKPAAEAIKSYREAEKRLHEVGYQRNRLEAELAAKDVLIEQLNRQLKPQEPQRPVSPWEGVDLQEKIITDPAAVLQTQEQRLRAEFEQRLATERSQILEQMQATEHQRELVRRIEAAGERAREALGYSKEQWPSVVAVVQSELLNPQSQYVTELGGVFSEQAWVQAVNDVVPRLVPQKQNNPAVTQPAEPPGAKRASVAQVTSQAKPKLAAEDKHIASTFKAVFGNLVTDDYEDRVAERLQQYRRNR